MEHVFERPGDESFISKWNPSQHCFTEEEQSLINKGKIICLERIPEKTKFFALDQSKEPKSICFPYEGKSPQIVFQEKFGKYSKVPVPENAFADSTN